MLPVLGRGQHGDRRLHGSGRGAVYLILSEGSSWLSLYSASLLLIQAQ